MSGSLSKRTISRINILKGMCAKSSIDKQKNLSHFLCEYPILIGISVSVCNETKKPLLHIEHCFDRNVASGIKVLAEICQPEKLFRKRFFSFSFFPVKMASMIFYILGRKASYLFNFSFFIIFSFIWSIFRRIFIFGFYGGVDVSWARRRASCRLKLHCNRSSPLIPKVLRLNIYYNSNVC